MFYRLFICYHYYYTIQIYGITFQNIGSNRKSPSHARTKLMIL